MKALIRFYKMSFVAGAHGGAIASGLGTVKLAADGNRGTAIAFGVITAIIVFGLYVWWTERSFPGE